MNDIELWHGDCLEMMEKIPEQSVSCVIADLPYGVLKHREWDKKIDISALWVSLKRVVKHNGVVACFCNMRFAVELMASNTAAFRYDLVWQKHSSSSFLMANKRPLNIHESILIFANPTHFYHPQMRPREERVKTWTPRNGMAYRSEWHASTSVNVVRPYGPMYPTSIFKTKEGKKKNIHPTQKPIAIVRWLVESFSKERDCILDPTAGSMTTAIAAQQTGRRAICIEKNAEYYRRGVERVKKAMAEPRQEALL